MDKINTINFNNIYSNIYSKKDFLFNKTVNNFYLPFTDQKTLNLAFFMQEQISQYSNYLLYPNAKIAGVYGSFPGLIWNGGRSFYNTDFIHISDMYNCLQEINNKSMICKFTFTNQLLEKQHCSNPLCNNILDLIADTKNEIVIFSDILENYIKEKYPYINLTSSITKGNSLSVLQNNLQKDYSAVVCFYKKNILQYISQLSKIDQNRIELLLNDEGCAHCSNSVNHFANESYNNLYGTQRQFLCNKQLKDYNDYETLLNLSNDEQLFYNIKYFQDLNIHNYKIRGRCSSLNNLASVYVNTLFMPEVHIDILFNIKKEFK